MNYLNSLWFSILKAFKLLVNVARKLIHLFKNKIVINWNQASQKKYLKQESTTVEVLSSLSYRTGELADYLNLIAKSVSNLLSVDWVAVTLCREGFEQIVASSIETAHEPDQLHSLHGSLTGSVINLGKCLYVTDTSKSKEYGEPPEGYLSYIGAPLKLPTGEIIGTICSFFHQPRNFTVKEMRLIEIFAERAATAIDNYNLYQRQQEMNKALQLEIQERKEAELSLRKSEEQLRQIAENLEPVVWMYSSNHEPIYISPMFEKVWGISCTEWYENSEICLTTVHPDEQELVEIAFNKVFTENCNYDLEYRIIRPDGGIRIIHDQAFPIIDDTGTIYRVAGIAEDITDRKYQQERISKAMVRLSEIGELAATIVHEVRNPLTTVLMGLSYFERMDLPEPAKKRLTLALDEAERLKRLLNEILLYARHEVIQPKPIDLIQEILSVIDNISHTQVAMGKQIFFDPLTQSLVISADMDKLKQVIINLLQNACEAVKEGEIIYVEVVSLSSSNQVCLQIRNGGIPISPDFLAKLTMPFFTTKSDGSGLGLAIVKKIVEAHEGRLDIQSSAIAGTVIRVFLPISTLNYDNNSPTSFPY